MFSYPPNFDPKETEWFRDLIKGILTKKINKSAKLTVGNINPNVNFPEEPPVMENTEDPTDPNEKFFKKNRKIDKRDIVDSPIMRAQEIAARTPGTVRDLEGKLQALGYGKISKFEEKKVNEDMIGGGAPTNNIGGGGIAMYDPIMGGNSTHNLKKRLLGVVGALASKQMKRRRDRNTGKVRTRSATG